MVSGKKRRLKVDIHLQTPDLIKSFILDSSKKLPRILTDLLTGNSQEDFLKAI
jgi:AraC family transcriptional regulator, transcriptional activator of the genes for pyochelin and ferripyochelin receptors